MIAARLAGNINVLSQFDVTLGPEDRQSHIAPHAQPSRGEPVDTHIARSAIAAHDKVAKVIESGMLRVVNVSCLRGDHFGPGRTGEEQELVRLMRADIAEDAAILITIVEPGWTHRRILAMRPQTDGLNNLSNGAGLDELAGFDSRATVKAFAVGDRENATSLCLHPPHLCDLLERSDRGLLGHEVLSV